MSSIREEILKLSVESLKNKVDSIMLSINIKLSMPEKSDNIVPIITDLLLKLAQAEGALVHATNLYNQCVILSLANKVSESNEQNNTTEE